MPMTNERAFEEFKFAVNQWFRHMDKATREKAVVCAHHGLTLPIGEVFHQEVIKKPAAAVQGRGECFTGKVWMLNRSTNERARVDPGEVESYASRGFERGGPRSK